jgi:organic radical activating enzyme
MKPSLFVARSKAIAARGLDEEMMVMSATNSTLFTLNEIASVIWQSLDGTTPLREIVARITSAQNTIPLDVALEDAEAAGGGTGSAWHLAAFRRADFRIDRFIESDPMNTLAIEMAGKALKRNIPLSVQLDLTYRCNERCIHCYLDHHDHGEMTTAEIKDLLDQMADAGVFYLTLSGGEILMRRDFFGILEHARLRTFCIKLKTNGVLIRKQEADRIKALGVESVQISIYSHRHEVHDAITKMPGSLRQSIEAVRLLREHGLHVIMANVLMRQNVNDYRGVRELAAELGAQFIVDPTITPMMDGDRSILNFECGRSCIARGVPKRSAGRERGRVLRSSARSRRRSSGHAALQCRAHRLLRLTLRRRLSMRAVSAAQRKRAAHEVCGHLARFASAQGSPIHHPAGHAIVLQVRPWRNMYALSGVGVLRRKHARTLGAGLRKVLCPHWDRIRKPKIQESGRINRSDSTVGSNPELGTVCARPFG